MIRGEYYKQLCKYCAYRTGYDTLCRPGLHCLKCNNSDTNGVCYCSRSKPAKEKTCPYFRYLAR